MSTHFQSVNDQSNGGPTSSSPWGVVLAGCGLVVTGHVLGVAWLREPVLGLPAGLWFIGLISALSVAQVRGRLADWLERLLSMVGSGGTARQIESHAGSESSVYDGAESAPGWWPRNRVASVCLDGATRVMAAMVQLAWLPLWGGELSVIGNARQRFERWLAGAAFPTRPLRVGLCLPDDEADALVETDRAAGAARVEWFRMGQWDDPVGACRRHLFDAAVYHDGEGPIRIVTLERPGHSASVIEWTDLVGELTFGKLFPGRVDAAAVVIEGASSAKVREGAGLLRAIVEGAATLARSEHRLTLVDRVLGRRPTDVIERPGGLALWKSSRTAAATAMGRIAEQAAQQVEVWPEAAAIGIDAASAFFVSAPGMAPCERLDGLRAVAEAGALSGKTALRLGATSIAALEDAEGMEWLVRADALLRDGSTTLAALDHAAFLESELSHGSEDPMGVGRAAAGICLVCAATPLERLPFVRDDMLEEMAYAGWLVGRDQDRGLLIRVFMEIERAHDGGGSGKSGSRTKGGKKRRSSGRSAAA
ncbi:MAG: hypothetical protein Q9O74_01645 [Planctomycetota bacterium]|nr:hypothetical protein [Planctomycetota bacterium]